ncbi:tyrosine-type recombinase/integrase [Deinococcus sp.]|uniref:tyrosine-type recombinase/integrase n=1 Tax=Deinococcus sp. TaxID=47478 RepID=UPI003B5C29F7
MTKAKGRNGWHAGTIEQLPSGRYRWRVRVTYPDGTKERQAGTVRTKTEAQQAITKALQEAVAGQRPVTKSLTVGEMVREHMAAMRPTWAQRTYLNNLYLFEHYILPGLADKKAAGIQPKDLRAHFEKLGESGLGVSGQKQVRSLLSGAYKRAVGDGVLRENPTAYARPVATRQAAKVKAFTPDEAGRFFASALEDRWALPLAFMAVTGLRIGEAVALTWEDVGTDRAGLPVVMVNKTRSEFQGQPYDGKPKTAAGVRAVPLSTDAAAIVEDMRRRVTVEADAHGKAVGPLSYVFPSPLTGEAMAHDSLRNIMERTCRRAGLPLLSPHKLRHTFASMNLALGLPVGDVSAVMGHASTAVTMNFYQTSYEVGRRAVALNLSPAKAEAPTARTPSTLGKRSRKAGPRRATKS